LSLWKKNVGGQLLEGLNISRADVKPAHLKLGMSPRGLESTRASVKFRIAFGEPDDPFARVCHPRDERELESLVRQNRNMPAKAEDRIKNGAGSARQAAAERNWIFRRAPSAEKLRAIGFELSGAGDS
jgi:hypothetical protein